MILHMDRHQLISNQLAAKDYSVKCTKPEALELQMKQYQIQTANISLVYIKQSNKQQEKDGTSL